MDLIKKNPKRQPDQLISPRRASDIQIHHHSGGGGGGGDGGGGSGICLISGRLLCCLSSASLTESFRLQPLSIPYRKDLLRNSSASIQPVQRGYVRLDHPETSALLFSPLPTADVVYPLPAVVAGKKGPSAAFGSARAVVLFLRTRDLDWE